MSFTITPHVETDHPGYNENWIDAGLARNGGMYHKHFEHDIIMQAIGIKQPVERSKLIPTANNYKIPASYLDSILNDLLTDKMIEAKEVAVERGKRQKIKMVIHYSIAGNDSDNTDNDIE